jgi:hypothetical protein
MTTTEKGVVSDFARGADWLDDGNGNWSQLRRSASPQWGYKASTTTGLTYGYFGGQAWTGSAWSTVADGTTALTDNTTNYVERTTAGVVSVAASNFTASKIPMAIVVTVAGVITTFSDARREQVPAAQYMTIPFVIDGGGVVITTGLKGGLQVDVAGTIVSVTTLALDTLTGSIVVDIWKDTYANHPPTVLDTITASAKPTISSATKATDSTLTGWTTAITAGDILFFNVDSVGTFTRVLVSLKVLKS